MKEDDPELFDREIVRFFEEDDFLAKINRTFLGLEVRITLDHFFNNAGAQLVNQQGKAVDVHPNTVKRYWELSGLIDDYTTTYGKNPQLEEMKNKWATPARKRYSTKNLLQYIFPKLTIL